MQGVRVHDGWGSFQSGTVLGTTAALRVWPRPLTREEWEEIGEGVRLVNESAGGPVADRGDCRPSGDRGPVWCRLTYRGELVRVLPVMRVWEDGSVRVSLGG